MSGPPPPKRQKIITIDYLSVIDSLPVRKLVEIVADAGRKDPEIAARVINEYIRNTRVEQDQTIDFGHHAVSVWNILNVEYCRLCCSGLLRTPEDVAIEIENIIRAIADATLLVPPAGFGLKKNALEALMEMGKSICESPGEFGKGVRDQFQRRTRFEKTMLRIVKSLTVDERKALVSEGFGHKLVAFGRQATEFQLFEVLKNVRQALLSAETFPHEKDSESSSSEESDDYDEKEYQSYPIDHDDGEEEEEEEDLGQMNEEDVDENFGQTDEEDDAEDENDGEDDDEEEGGDDDDDDENGGENDEDDDDENDGEDDDNEEEEEEDDDDDDDDDDGGEEGEQDAF